jgi:hypothetical protein
MKKLIVPLAIAMVAGAASATSALDAATNTAIAAGFVDMKDTALDVMKSTWAPYLGILAIMLAPKIIKRIANKL